MKKKKSGRNKQRTANKAVDEPNEIKKAPHTYVIHRGLSCPVMLTLSRDFRKMMEPFTASSLQEKKSNKIKDFVSLSGIFNVSHMCLFTRSDKAMSMKISRLPKGPTLSFRVHSFILAKDVLSSLRKQYVEEGAFKHPPLVILNSFSGEGNHMKLMANTFQNMFPPINLTSIKLQTVKRCVLISYNPATNLIDFRHYAVTLVPTGVNKGVKKIAQRKIPDMSKMEDISDFITKGHLLSDSEFEDEDTHVTLAQGMKRGNVDNAKSAVRLYELGPRLTVELHKIESELLTGEVLYHKFVVKTQEEMLLIKKKRADKRVLKEQRKKIQSENVAKKDKTKEEHKIKTGGSRQQPTATDRDQILLKDAEDAIEDIPEDDAEYYEDEIGEAPEKELFDGAVQASRKRPHIKGMKAPKVKRPKLDTDQRKQGGKFDRDDKFKGKGGKFDRDEKFKGKGFKGNKAGSSFKSGKGSKPSFKIGSKGGRGGGKFKGKRK